MPIERQEDRKNSLRRQVTKIKPCFGFFLTGAVKAVAFIDISISLYSIIYIGLHLPEWRKKSQVIPNDDPSVRIGFWAWYLTQMCLTILLSIFLFHSATYRSIDRCKIWMGVAISLFLIWMAVFVSHLALFGLPIMTISLFSTFSIYRAYTFVVVYAFIKEIRLYGGFNCALRGLSDKEIEEFVLGNPAVAMKAAEGSKKAEHQPYNQEYEIPIDNLNIDTENPLGKGQYGLVLKGNLKLPDGTFTLVAVKTTNPNQADVAYFKSILSELKIMTYVGKHENIVNLIGACTANIRDRNLLIVVDFCPYGNLQQYLTTRRGFFVNLVRRGNICRDSLLKQYCNIQAISPNEAITTIDLFRWACEISHGLKYLASKKVIHGDLATRNVLLSYDKVAKISDFGLSKQLYHCSVYTKSEEVGESFTFWRWLALESLKDMKFSTQSDIWSLGVTIWEIFSLAETPFPGLTWTAEFVDYINRGLRMNKPAYATDEIYNLLLECWDNSPENRPSLDRIVTIFEEFLMKYQGLDSMISGFNSTESESSDNDNAALLKAIANITDATT